MPKFTKHFTLEEARSMLPALRKKLEELAQLKSRMEKSDEKISRLIGLGDDLGGPIINNQLRVLAAMKSILLEIQQKGILIKDLDRGLIDFPSLRSGKEIFLCWEKDEDDIEFWHDLEVGFSGREKL